MLSDSQTWRAKSAFRARDAREISRTQLERSVFSSRPRPRRLPQLASASAALEHSALRRTAALAAQLSPPAAPAVLLGGAVLDVQAWPDVAPQAGTTVPGRVVRTPGGVARNIACSLASLLPPGSPPLLLSVVGDDAAGAALLSSLGRLPRGGVRVVAGARTATVVAVFGGDADILAAVADCLLVESHLDAEWVSRFETQLLAAPIVLLDTNASPAALLAASRHAAGRLWVEPVSVAKAARAAPLLANAAFVSPNAAELVALALAVRVGHARGGPPLPSASAAHGYADAAQALGALRCCIDEVLAAGCKHCVTTLGPAGCLLSWRAGGTSRHLAIPAQRVPVVVSTAGAGDALVAGALASLCRGEAAAAAVAAGAAAAAVVVQRAENVPIDWPSRLELAASAAALLAAARELS